MIRRDSYVHCSAGSLFFFFLLIIPRSVLLDEIRRSGCISESQRILCLILQDRFWFVHILFGSMYVCMYVCMYVLSSLTIIARGYPRSVMVKAMDCGIVVNKFVHQSRYYVHSRANTLGKGMNPRILPAMG